MLVFKHINNKKIEDNNERGHKPGVNEDENSFSIYPNPITGQSFNLVLNNLSTGVYLFNFYTLSGELMISKKLQFSPGNGTYNIRISAYTAPGKYHIQLFDSDGNVVNSMPVTIDR
jgi:hypothetical protein